MGEMTMVERVARALAEVPEAQESDVLYYPFEKRPEVYLALARAAIEAMREPTETMLKAGELPGWDDAVSIGLNGEIWSGMISAALTPSDQEGR